MDQNSVIDKSQKEPKSQKKIIKRYGNRKLYDTEQSSYVVLNDIARMIRNNEEVCVIDNETKDDITNSTLTQIIFGAEKKSNFSAPLEILKSIIMKGDGSLSNFLAEMGLFKVSQTAENTKKIDPLPSSKSPGVQKSSSLEERIANAAVASTYEIAEENELPELPNSNKNLDQQE